MSDNPYAPPGSHIGQPAAAQGQMARPWQVVAAVCLATVNYGIGFAARLATWKDGNESSIVLIFILLLHLLMNFGIYHRWNWARITLLLQFLGSTGMIFSGFERMMDRPTITVAVAVAGVPVNAVCLYFVFISPGRHWFRW